MIVQNIHTSISQNQNRDIRYRKAVRKIQHPEIGAVNNMKTGIYAKVIPTLMHRILLAGLVRVGCYIRGKGLGTTV